MMQDDKKIMLSELKRVPYDYLVLIDTADKCLYRWRNNKLAIKKLLIKNDLGIFGNLFYKNIKEFDLELVEAFILRDFKNIGDNYFEFNFDTYRSDIPSFTCKHPLYKEACLDKRFLIKLSKLVPKVALFICNDEIKNDREFYLKLLENYSSKYPESLFYYDKIPKELKSDKDFIVGLIKINSNYINEVDYSMFRDIDIANALLDIDWPLFKRLPYEARNNKLIVEKALKSSVMAFQYASDGLKKDKDYILELYKTYDNILDYIDPELKKDKTFIKDALMINSKALLFADTEIVNNIEFIITLALRKIKVVVSSDVYFEISCKYGDKYNEYIISE